MKNEMISIVIPAKNESETIGELVEGLLSTGLYYEVLVIDDGSTDGTGNIAQKAGARVIKNPYSKGNGAAIKTGIRCAEGGVIVFMDGDGQHLIEEIPRLLDMYRKGYDMVVGKRYRIGHASFMKRWANNFYNKLASWMVGQNVQDLTSGMRVCSKDKMLEFIDLLPNGFSYPTTSTMAFFRAGYNVGYRPIKVNQRKGKSNINIYKDGIRFLLIIFKVGVMYSPLKIFLPISVFTMILGIGYYIYTLLLFGRFTNMSALLIQTSILIFLMGLISEQITALSYLRSKADNHDNGEE